MSETVSERLVMLLPLYLSFDEKYKLLAKLWGKYQKKGCLKVEIDPTAAVERAVAAVIDAALAVEQNDIPPEVLRRLDWLTNKEGQAARALLSEVVRRKGVVIAEKLGAEVRCVLDAVRRSPGQV